MKNYLFKYQDSSYLDARTEPLNFYTLVWDNMKFSLTTLGTLPELLRDAQRFYREVDCIHNEITKGNIGISVGVSQLQDQINRIQKELLPTLDSSTKKIEKILEGTDVVL